MYLIPTDQVQKRFDPSVFAQQLQDTLAVTLPLNPTAGCLQCPEDYPAGDNELHAAAAASSSNNMLTVTLTDPGTYYFACQVRTLLTENQGCCLMLASTTCACAGVRPLCCGWPEACCDSYKLDSWQRDWFHNIYCLT